MSSILDAVNVSTDEFIIGKLPTKPGDVSIMTMEQAFNALNNSSSYNYGDDRYDSTRGYNSSTFYMYAINDTAGTNDAVINSTSDNLKLVGLSWYQQLNKPTTKDNHWTVNSHQIFGGPLCLVYHDSDGYYCFSWYYLANNRRNSSHHDDYWYSLVAGSVYVAIVHRSNDEDKIEMTKEELIAHGKKWLEDGYILNDKDRAFIEVAIKALEE